MGVEEDRLCFVQHGSENEMDHLQKSEDQVIPILILMQKTCTKAFNCKIRVVILSLPFDFKN